MNLTRLIPRFVLVICVLCKTYTALGQQSPQFAISPLDSIVPCSSNIDEDFILWYFNDAGARPVNAEHEIIAILELGSALDSLDAALNGCSGTGSLILGFYVMDDTGQISSDTLFASFTVADILRPVVTRESHDVSMVCDGNSLDSLHSWIQSAAGAMLSDDCDPSPQWVSYSWTDSNGNSGSGDFTSLHTIEISRTSCIWSAEFNFFGTDACGNINNTIAEFEITGDIEAPALIDFPKDTMVECSQTIPVQQALFIDGCDGTVSTELSELSTQSTDSLQCSYYSYDIRRTWTAIDACGNSASHTQIIMVRDTVPPALEFESIVAIDCDEDINTIKNFISFEDACSRSNLTYQDSILTTGICNSRIRRTYLFQDLCSNTIEARQDIQIEDFTGPTFESEPMDINLSCGIDNINQRFQNWINNFGFAETQDNCNKHFRYVRNENNLSDTNSIIQAQTARLMPIGCQSGASNNIVFSQEFYFYTYDICGNITMSSAQFNLIDTIPPTIPNCPESREMILDNGNCQAPLTLIAPFAIDPCLAPSELLWNITVDDVFVFEKRNKSIDFLFDIGEHVVEYSITDCAGNQNICLQNITVRDTINPVLVCPDDIAVYLSKEECEALIEIPELDLFDDNCFGPADFSARLPEGEGFIEFIRDDSDSSYSAQSFIIEFEDVVEDQRYFKPVLTLEYALNLDVRSRLVLKSEFSEELFVAEKLPCVRQKHKLLIDENQFEGWSKDNDINFFVVVETNGDKGIIPCAPENLDGPSDIDEFSFFKMTLEYSEIEPELMLIDAEGNSTEIMENTVLLESGNYTLSFQSEDLDGNIGSCSSQITVIDTLAPEISCNNQILILSPDTELFVDIDLDELDITVDDNCTVERINFFPSDFSCQQINRNIDLVVQAWDDSDNFSFCSSQISIQAASLEPVFIAGLCLADTIKLFANLDANINGSFNWTGPNDFISNDRNPVISNADIQSSGRYRLMLTTNNGCNFSGFVDIDVSRFNIPEISSESDVICRGESITLMANAFTEEVSYLWYLGEKDKGVLISETINPELEVFPLSETNSYYVVVEGEDCLSESSDNIIIELEEVPEAEVIRSFITACEGEDILLESSDNNTFLTYRWSGPDGFQSREISPELLNINPSSTGLYSLIVSNGICESEPASTQVIVNSKPERPIIRANDVYCEGERVVLEADSPNALKYLWYLNGELFSSSNNDKLVIPDIDNTFEGTWQLIIDDGLCVSDSSDTLILEVEAKPTIGASNNSPVCEGDSVRLTCSFLPNATYIWESPSGNLFFTREFTSLAVEGIYTVSVTSSNACVSKTLTEVEIRTRPRITAISNTAKDCMAEGSQIEINPSVFPPGNYDYNWSGPGNFNSSDPSVILENIMQEDAGRYSLIINDGFCNSIESHTELDFNIEPEKPIVLGDSIICENEILVLEISNPISGQDVTYRWIGPQGEVISSNPRLELSNPITGIYRVRQEKNGCLSEYSDSKIINVLGQAEPPLIFGPSYLCEGSSLELSTGFVENTDFMWLLPGGDTLIQEERFLRIDMLQARDTGQYFLRLLNEACISESSESFQLSFSEAPDPLDFTEDTIHVCRTNGESVQICFENLDNITELIRLVELPGMNSMAESLDSCVLVDLARLENKDRVTVMAESIRGNCSTLSEDSLEIILNDEPDSFFEISEKSSYLCEGSEITVMAEDPGINISINWLSNANVAIRDAQSPVTLISNISTGQTILIAQSVSKACGIYAIDSLILIKPEAPMASDDAYEFEPSSKGYTMSVLNNDMYTEAVNIDILDSQIDADVEIINQEVHIQPRENIRGDFMMRYSICYEECPELCSYADILIKIFDEEECLASNVITPNGDGINDSFVITCLEGQKYPNSSLIIFNNWGDELYRAAPYDNSWQGSYRDEALPSGTYYFIFNRGDGSAKLAGFIALERG